MKATEKDIRVLKKLYDGRFACFGDLHNHSASTSRSDGTQPLSHWRGAMEALGLDFAAILDHRQVEHMYLSEWEDGVFIGGTEPGTHIVDSKAESGEIHYNMLFENGEPVKRLLERFPEYGFTGGNNGEFFYPDFTTERFNEVIRFVKENGGFFVHPHPKKMMVSSDPLDYWFQDETGMEVFYWDMRNQLTGDNYKLWTDLLALGKRIWATGGVDNHACAADTALTCIYTEEKKNASYLSHLRTGDFVCGSVGLQMCVEDTTMGGVCLFTGKRLVLGIKDFHRSIYHPEHQYRVDLLNDKGVVFSEEISCTEPAYFAIDTENCRFYRAEVFDATQNLRVAIGNPIWNK